MEVNSHCYKYHKRSDLGFQALSRSEIYFAGIEQLNDSQECRPAYFSNGSQELYHRFVCVMYWCVYRPSIDVQSFDIDSREFLLNHDFIRSNPFHAYDSLTEDLI